jgi:hypothetical protein
MRAVRSLAIFFLAVAALGSTALAGEPFPSPGGLTIGQSFGVQVKGLTTTARDLNGITGAGFGLLRYAIGWSYVEKSPGRYSWKEFDTLIGAARRRGLRSIIILTDGNPLYSGKARVSRTGSDGGAAHVEMLPAAPASDAAIRGFARFAAAAVQRYKGSDIVWEIWNEPDLDYFWPPKANAGSYVALASAACREMRKADPVAKIVGPAAASMPGWRDELGFGLIARVLGSPVGSCIDAISFHSYRIERGRAPRSPESVMQDNVSAAAFIAGYRTAGQAALPMICSEWGYNTLEITRERQADYVLRTHLSNLLSGVGTTIWYEWRDSFKDRSDTEANYGLIDHDGYDKPAVRALRATLPRIRNERIERRVPTNDPRDYVVALDGRDGRKLVFWTAVEGAEHDVSIDVDGRSQVLRLTSRPEVADLGKVGKLLSGTGRTP